MSPKQIIFKLETKVESAIDLIHQLKQRITQLSLEKDQIQKKFQEYEETVQGKLDEYEERVLELEKLVDFAQKEQSNLEKSVVNAISNFETIEELQNGIDITNKEVSSNTVVSTQDNSNNTAHVPDVDTHANSHNEALDNSNITHNNPTEYNTPSQLADDSSDTIFVSDDPTNDTFIDNNTQLDSDSTHEDNVFSDNDDINDINIDEIDFSSDFTPNPDDKEANTKLEII